VGCGRFPNPPDIRPKQILHELNICKQYVADFGDKLTFKFEKDIPIEDCLIDGHFVLTDSELVDLRKAYNELKKCTQNKKCKKRL